MARGSIHKRGERSWQIVYDAPGAPTASASNAARGATVSLTGFGPRSMMTMTQATVGPSGAGPR